MPDGGERPPPGRFIGRIRERGELGALIAGLRLVTVVGPGGSGKTRLAREVVLSLNGELRDGAVFVDLSVVETPAMVANAVGAAVGLRDDGGAGLGQALEAFVATKTMLLVLDNCEHLAEACGELLLRLLAAGERLKVLATSREPLRLPNEVAWRIPGLSAPGAGAGMAAIEASESVLLFCERAREVSPGFALSPSNAAAVASLCRELDGMPLAIELAAARIRDLPVGEIAERIGVALREGADADGGPAGRQQTLRATIDWSYDLLTPEQRVLLRRLSVFRGGWTVEAAARVCGFAPLSAESVAAVHGALVDRSMVIASPAVARYHLLETVRRYGAAKLDESGETEDLHNRHMAWAAAFARQWGPGMTARIAEEAASRLTAEEPNIAAALNRSVADEPGKPTLVEMAGSLGTFWAMTIRMAATWPWVELALSLTEGERTPRRCAVLLAAGQIIVLNDVVSPTALPYFDEAHQLAKEGGNPRELIRALHGLAYSYPRVGRGGEAFAVLQEALGIARATEDHFWEGVLLPHMAIIAASAGDTDRGQEMADEALHLARRGGFTLNEVLALNALNEVCKYRGDWAHGVVFCRQELAACRLHGLVWLERSVLFRLAHLEQRAGNTEEALEAINEALALDRRYGRAVSPALTLAAVAALCPAPRFARAGARLLGAAKGRQPYYEAIDPTENVFDRDRFRQAIGSADFEAEWDAGWHTGEADALKLAEETIGHIAAHLRRFASHPDARPVAGLTMRETEILRLVAHGDSNQGIAVSLSISLGTAQRHVANIFTKIGANNRSQATAFAIRAGLSAE